MPYRTQLPFAAFAAALLSAAPASAAIILEAHPFSSPDPTPQIHNTGTQSGTTVTGVTVPGGVLYDFTSTSTLSANGSGHAKVEGPFHELTFTPHDLAYGFTAIDFNLNVSGVKKATPFYANILVTTTAGVTKLFDNLSLGNGQNKYLIFGDDGEIFRSVSFAGWRDTANTVFGQFDDIRQVDVDSYLIPSAAVPEPATWAMMIAGFGLVGGALRRRKASLSMA